MRISDVVVEDNGCGHLSLEVGESGDFVKFIDTVPLTHEQVRALKGTNAYRVGNLIMFDNNIVGSVSENKIVKFRKSNMEALQEV